MTNTKIWAHRGASAFAPENTLEAFQMAAEMGAYGVELDIQLTRDGEIVVIHDEKLERTTNGQGYVKKFTLAELKKLTPEIPTLAEVYALLKPTNLVINVELKTGVFDYEGIEAKALELTEQHNMSDSVVYSSFNHYSLQRIKELNPIADIALLCGGGIFVTAQQCKYMGASALHAQARQFNHLYLVEDCRKHGVKLRFWTVDDPTQLEAMREKGVDGVFTNKLLPGVMQEATLNA